jgi:hypothetical protein
LNSDIEGRRSAERPKKSGIRKRKKKKNGSLLTFFSKRTNTSHIPSTVQPSAPVRGHKLTPASSSASPSPSPAILPVVASPVTVHTLKPAVEPVISDFLEKLYNLIEKQPTSIPEASDYDRLAVFAGNPAEYDNPSLSPDELWEETLNELFKSVLGWGTEGNMDEVIRRGKKGLDGLANFVKHFVIKRGVSMGLFEGKLAHLMSKLEEK